MAGRICLPISCAQHHFHRIDSVSNMQSVCGKPDLTVKSGSMLPSKTAALVRYGVAAADD
jgi:hypothetical protein